METQQDLTGIYLSVFIEPLASLLLRNHPQNFISDA